MHENKMWSQHNKIIGIAVEEFLFCVTECVALLILPCFYHTNLTSLILMYIGYIIFKSVECLLQHEEYDR